MENSGSSEAESNVDVEEDFYEIDAVIDRRVYKNKLQYLVRWKVSRCIQKSILMLGLSILTTILSAYRVSRRRKIHGKMSPTFATQQVSCNDVYVYDSIVCCVLTFQVWYSIVCISSGRGTEV